MFVLGGDPRVLAGLHRVLLGREAERVVAHRVQHVLAAHPLEAGVDVGADVPERVADVEAGAARDTGTCRGRRASSGRRPRRTPRAADPSGWGPRRCARPSHRSCHFASISLATRASYRYRGSASSARCSSVSTGFLRPLVDFFQDLRRPTAGTRLPDGLRRFFQDLRRPTAGTRWTASGFFKIWRPTAGTRLPDGRTRIGERPPAVVVERAYAPRPRGPRPVLQGGGCYLGSSLWGL